MTKKITVYTQPDCPPCKIVKQFLDHHQFQYTEIDISTDFDARERLVYDLESSSTPTVTVGESVVRGFDLQELEKLLGV
ncbi:glutaredoxin domain-containing protein [Metabacillus arenae]|uniref:NrdH-redoxin n=1 Tax=Metabacillus arenae TaxID=2771434 RepID=A0A926NJT5_9BACI|nr:glutaredoxin domain-containing protein [Metabacillus arenae]MBD1381278.1 NrdH-redoxin [Metabacillus arenae]